MGLYNESKTQTWKCPPKIEFNAFVHCLLQVALGNSALRHHKLGMSLQQIASKQLRCSRASTPGTHFSSSCSQGETLRMWGRYTSATALIMAVSRESLPYYQIFWMFPLHKDVENEGQHDIQ